MEKYQWIMMDPCIKPMRISTEDLDKLYRKEKRKIQLCLLDSILLKFLG